MKKNLSNKQKSILTAKEAMAYRNELYGIAALWIILFHVSDYTAPMHVGEGGINLINLFFHILRIVFHKGNTGVDIFLFLSGIGLYQSIHKNSLPVFYLRRFNRVVIPYLLVTILYFLWHDFIVYDNGWSQYLRNLFTIELWQSGKHPLWYASFIVIMYVIYPILYKLDEKTKHVFTIVLIIAWISFTAFMCHYQWGLYVHVERAVSRVPIFLLGIIAAPFVFEGGSIPIKKYLFVLSCITTIVSMSIILIFQTSMDSYIRRYLMGVAGIGIIIIWSFLRNENHFMSTSKLLSFVGAISFETYLIHVIIKEIVDIKEWWDILPTWLWYIVVITLTIPFAWLLSKIALKIKKYLKLDIC